MKLVFGIKSYPNFHREMRLFFGSEEVYFFVLYWLQRSFVICAKNAQNLKPKHCIKYVQSDGKLCKLSFFKTNFGLVEQVHVPLFESRWFGSLTIGTGTCLQLFEKWRRSAHLKLSQLIWQQQNFLSKQMTQSLNFFSYKSLDGVTSVPLSICLGVLNP